jgi:DNA-binding transcriptional LysR family regulator
VHLPAYKLSCLVFRPLIDKNGSLIDWVDMNIHHLELFYYVARHGGISEGVRNMPYGIQQPAMSGQIIQLEESLGVTLFNRRPFALTPQGEELFQYIRPFFDNLGQMEERLRGGVSQQIRIGASELVLRNYLPSVLQVLREQFPKLKCTLRDGYQPDLEQYLQKQEIDLAITLLEGKPSGGINSLSLLKLPLVLLVPKESAIRSSRELLEQDRIDIPLISLPASESIYKNFQKGLSRLKVDWFTSIEVSTIELIETYVREGYGVGVSVAVPGIKHSASFRMLPLAGFDPVEFGVLWHGKPGPVVKACIQAIEQTAKGLVE